MELNMEQIGSDVLDLIKESGERLGAQAKEILEEDKKYAGYLLKLVAKTYGKKGFDEGLEAAYDAIKLTLAMNAVNMADEAESELKQFAKGVISMAVKLIGVI